MSDNPAPEVPVSTEDPNGTNPNPKSAPPAEAPVKETDWRAEARKWEDRAKANKDAAARLAELEEAQKSAEQKQAEALETAQKELAAYKKREQVSQWAADVSKETGVPASALRGDTLEELQAHAEELKSLITPPKQTADPVPTIGTTPQSGNIPIRDQIAAAEASGNKELVAALKAMQLSNS